MTLALRGAHYVVEGRPQAHEVSWFCAAIVWSPWCIRFYAPRGRVERTHGVVLAWCWRLCRITVCGSHAHSGCACEAGRCLCSYRMVTPVHVIIHVVWTRLA